MAQDMPLLSKYLQVVKRQRLAVKTTSWVQSSYWPGLVKKGKISGIEKK